MSGITVADWILIGAVGGSAAGLFVWILNMFHTHYLDWKDKRQVYNWLYSKTESKNARKWRSTRTIASYNNLTEDRVRYICSIHKNICLSTGDEPDLWGIIKFTREATNHTNHV